MAPNTAEDDDAPNKAEDDDAPTCRICFSEGGDLVAPCECKGTQQYVHVSCLNQWQRACKGGPAARRCSVCRAPFTVKPPREPWLSRRLADGRTVAQMSIALVALIAMSLGRRGCFSAAVAVAAGVFAGHLDPRQIVCAAVSLVLVALTLHACGLRLTVVGAGADRRLAFIRHGEPVEQLRAGLFLVSEGIERGVFGRSVILLTQHDAAGSFGIVVNKPRFVDGRQEFYELSGGQYFSGRGGPVDVDKIQFLLWRSSLRLDRGPFAVHAVQDFELPRGVNATYFADMEGAADLVRRLDEAGARGGALDALFVNGYAGWGAHQLDGEVRAGAWRLVDATAEDLFADRRECLWEKLLPRADAYRD